MATGAAAATAAAATAAAATAAAATVAAGAARYGDTENVKSAKGVKSVKPAPKASGHSGSNAWDGGSCIANLTSIGNSGIGSGNQIASVTQVPVEISGNAVGIVGNAQAWSIGGAFANC